MNILVLTDIIPAPILTKQKRENDVLITTADLHEHMQKDVKYTFVFIVPYSNFFFSLISKKWKEFVDFRRLKSFQYKNRTIEIITVPNILRNGLFKSVLIPIGYFMNRKKLKRIIKDHDIDIVHAHTIKSEAGIAHQLYKRFKIPYVITTRELGTVEVDRSIKKYISNAKAIISQGYLQKTMADQLHENSYLLPHGVDSRFLTKEKIYSRDTAPLRIVTLSRLLVWKNIDKVLLALEKIQHGFIFDIYGDGPAEEGLKDLLSKLTIQPYVNFKGYIPYEEVPDMLVNYDLFILPSYKEKFGRVYIEAMACGLPVIGAKTCGMDGYIQEGVHGFTVNHKDVDEISNVINKFISDDTLKITLGKNAKKLAEAFPWEEIINKLDCIYKNAIK